jgi:hypothetical protein
MLPQMQLCKQKSKKQDLTLIPKMAQAAIFAEYRSSAGA